MCDRYVIINLPRESFTGRVVESQTNFLILDDITENISGKKVPGILNFPKSQILEIKDIDVETSRFEHKLCCDAWYIYQMDEKYHKMVEALKSKTVFAMFSENVEFGRNSRMTILSFATEDKVYILDYLNFQKIHKDLKEILEDNSILKIIFDCGKLCDYFKFHQKILIDGVYDPLIAEDIGYINLIDLIQKHFKVQFDEGNCMNFNIRPLSSNLKYSTAKKTIYLRKLFNRQLLNMLANIDSFSISDTSHNSCSSSAYEKKMSVTNESSVSSIDDYVGEILVIRMEHEILVGECTHNSKYYLKLKNIINPKTGVNLGKQELELYKKHMLSVDRIETGSRPKKVDIPEKNICNIQKFKVNIMRPKIYVDQRNLQEVLSTIKSQGLIVLYIQNRYFQILIESTVYNIDNKFLKVFESSLENIRSIKIQNESNIKLSGFLEPTLIPNVLSLEEFTKKYIDLSDQLISECQILILEVYFIHLMKTMFSPTFSKSKKYANFYRFNEDWELASFQMANQTLSCL